MNSWSFLLEITHTDSFKRYIELAHREHSLLLYVNTNCHTHCILWLKWDSTISEFVESNWIIFSCNDILFDHAFLAELKNSSAKKLVVQHNSLRTYKKYERNILPFESMTNVLEFHHKMKIMKFLLNREKYTFIVDFFIKNLNCQHGEYRPFAAMVWGLHNSCKAIFYIEFWW